MFFNRSGYIADGIVNRDNVEKKFGQNYVIRELKELVTVIR